MTEWQVVLSDLAYGSEENAAVLRVLASGWLSSGPEVASFEQEFAMAVGTTDAVAVSSATAALHVSLVAAGVQPGDEVVQPALNFVAAANMTVACGGTPVFADIASLDEPTVTRETVEPLLTDRTKAVVVMHYGGTAAEMDGLVLLCAERGIALIEDACHAVGTTYGASWSAEPSKPVGSLGAISCFSFFSNKNLATGEGGMVATNDRKVAATCRQLRSHGMTTMSWQRHQGHAYSYDVAVNGFNYRMDELHAALGRAQLASLPKNNAARIARLDRYRRHLPDGWSMPFASSQRPTSGHLAVVLAPTGAARNAARASMARAKVQTSFHYPLITNFTAFANGESDLPVSDEFCLRALTIPLHPNLSPADQDLVLSVLGG